MSKKHKTRQAKIISDLRRKLETASPSVQSENQATISTSFSYSPKSVPEVLPAQKLSTLPTVHIKKDLIKTLILSTLAISFELVLYFLIG